MLYAAVAIAVVAIGCAIVLLLLLRRARAEARSAKEAQARLEDVARRYAGILDLEGAQAKLQAEVRATEEQIQRQRAAAVKELRDLNDAIAAARVESANAHAMIEIEAHGLYDPEYDLETSELFRERLDAIRAQQKAMIKDGEAAVCDTAWTVEGSAAKGRKMAKDNIKMMLRAFNGASDAAVLKVKYNNVAALEQRITKSYESINKLNEVNRCRIVVTYLRLKLDELRLAHKYQEKRQAELEEQRRIKEQMREEQRANAEIEKMLRDAEADERRYNEALAKARAEVEGATGKRQAKLVAKLEELERKLQEAQANKQRATSRAQLTRSGHVYVISNIGSFGEEVYKIGMTRRLVPDDRVKELGDASVPFPFDVHAMIYTEDAPKLESELHKVFDDHRVNRVNTRKEFFRVGLSEIEAAVHRVHGQIEFTQIVEAEEYRRSQSWAPARAGGGVA